MKWGMGQALSCDLTARAERYFSYFLTFRVLGQKPKNLQHPLTPVSQRIRWSLPCTTSLTSDNKAKNQTHSFHPLLVLPHFRGWGSLSVWMWPALCQLATMPGNMLLQIWHLCCYCSLWQYDSDTWFSESARKTTQGFTVKPKGVNTGRKAKGLLSSIIQWFTAQCAWGAIVTWKDSELLAWRKALAHGARFQRRSQSSLTQSPAFLVRRTLQRLERTKQQQNDFHWGAGDSGGVQQPGAVDKRAGHS